MKTHRSELAPTTNAPSSVSQQRRSLKIVATILGIGAVSLVAAHWPQTDSGAASQPRPESVSAAHEPAVIDHFPTEFASAKRDAPAEERGRAY